MTAPRLWRYEVDEVWGSMEGRLHVGDVIVDKWKSNRTWTLYDFTTRPVEPSGGWHAKLLGEAPPEVAEQVRAKWEAERKSA